MISPTEERIKTNKLLMDICNFNKDLFDTSTLSSDEIRYYNKITDGFNKQIQFFIDWLDSDEAKRIFQDYTRYNEQAFNNIDEYTQEIIENTKLTSDEIINKLYDTGLTNGYKEIRRTKHYNDATKYGLKFLQDYNFSLITNVNEDLKKHIKAQIFNGIVSGETMPEVAQKILHAHETSLTGKTLSARQRAMMIARTETARAMTQGRLQSYANYGVQEVKILTAGDNSVCAICREAEAKIYPIEEAVNLVPFHPLCRCSVTAYIRHGILPRNPDEDAQVINLTPLTFRDLSRYNNKPAVFHVIDSNDIPSWLPEILQDNLYNFDIFLKNNKWNKEEYIYGANLTTEKVSKYISRGKENNVSISSQDLTIFAYDTVSFVHSHTSAQPFNHEDFEEALKNPLILTEYMMVHTPNDIFICKFKKDAINNMGKIVSASEDCFNDMSKRNSKFKNDFFAAEALWYNYLNDDVLNKYMEFWRIRKNVQ